MAQKIASRGHLYTPEDHLGILVPTNALKALIFKHLEVGRPSIINDTTEKLPNLETSLYHNIREYNFPTITGVERQREELTPMLIAQTIRTAGWLLQNFITVATTISATGMTVLDTLWYKPYESEFTALEHHSIVASSRQTGILIWATDVNSLLGFNERFCSLAVRR